MELEIGKNTRKLINKTALRIVMKFHYELCRDELHKFVMERLVAGGTISEKDIDEFAELTWGNERPF